MDEVEEEEMPPAKLAQLWQLEAWWLQWECLTNKKKWNQDKKLENKGSAD